MNIATVLRRLNALDVELSIESHDLVVMAPPGVLTEEVVQQIQQFKPQLIDTLRAKEQPSAPVIALKNSPVEDPRPDCHEDSGRWTSLLVLAFEADDDGTGDMFWRFHALRAEGARIKRNNGRLVISTEGICADVKRELTQPRAAETRHMMARVLTDLSQLVAEEAPA